MAERNALPALEPRSPLVLQTLRGQRPPAPRYVPTTSAQPCHFKHHEHTKKHKGVVQSCGAPALANLAPTPRQFQKVLEAFDAGRAKGDTPVRGVGKRHKIRNMIFCLAEAVRERARADLALARSLTFHSDASKNRLLLLCQMCGDDLRPRHCLLGTVDMEDDGAAAGIAAAILRILRDLCTPLLGAPFLGAAAPKGQTDLLALSHIMNITEVFNADAAADEQLAGHIIQNQTECRRLLAAEPHCGRAQPEADAADAAGGGGAVNLPSEPLPNLKAINKDKPHAARSRT